MDMTAAREDEVRDFVEELLRGGPDLSTEDLRDEVAPEYPEVRDMSLRKFHGKFALPVKRFWINPDDGADEESDREEAPDEVHDEEGVRRNVRETLVEFAKEVAGAESDEETIEALKDIDRYVDQAMDVVDEEDSRGR